MPEPGSKSYSAARAPRTGDEWAQYYDLRWRVLRAPWKQPRGSERDELDDSSIHRLLTDEAGAVIAVGRLHFNSPAEAQVRFMAVDPAWQGKACGGIVLRELEREARKVGVTSVVLNARDAAQRFYQRHGYVEVGAGETLFGEVAHVRMRKLL